MTRLKRLKGGAQAQTENSLAFQLGADAEGLSERLRKSGSLSRFEATVNKAVANRVVPEGANDSPAVKAEKAKFRRELIAQLDDAEEAEKGALAL